MVIIEAQKPQKEIPDSPQINRLVRHVNHMKNMLAVSEEALSEAIRDFQETCEHDFEEINDTSPNFWQGEPVIIVKLTGYKCCKCLLFKPVQLAQ
ncbi:MAG: hypothetical protein UR98_C0011G0007 [Parcubacteria group bacterium GW2011_GWA1_36_12]|nr:MAG: hypothetical protein UR98_C0011G0007 [Parcubacteria group bacterium GW2011_GWA1_36_12]